MSIKENDKRILKNTSYLYLRMLITMVISLYTARIILENLGVDDFGIYNVVGGIVTLMSFLNSAMSSATQRFLAYDLGQNDIKRFSITYSMLFNTYILLCLLIFILLEIAGPIYISNYMTIDSSRISAAQWVFQFSLFAFLINTISVPFRSAIIVYEKMDIFAYITIYESISGLFNAFIIKYFEIDQLILYGLFMLLMQFPIIIFSYLYCKGKLLGCVYINKWDSAYFKAIASYAGWNLFGSVTSVLNLQGQAIILNLFFGPAVNAAKAIADRINGMITSLSVNFYMAVTPQIVKSYASGNIEYMKTLVINSSRYSFYLLFVVSIPIFVTIQPLLLLWLGNTVTQDMVYFSRSIIIFALINILEQPLTMTVRSTGNIKKYQIVLGVITLTFIPFCVLLFCIGCPAYYSVLLLSFIYFIATFVRLVFVCPIIGIRPLDYFKEVLVPIVVVLAITSLCIYILLDIVSFQNAAWAIQLICFIIVAIVVCIVFGIRSSEKTEVIRTIRKYINKNK